MAERSARERRLDWPVAPDVRETITALENRLARVEQELAILKSARTDTLDDEVVAVRDIPREQAKSEIRQVFTVGGVHYMSEVAEFLHLPDDLVVDICAELMSEGELEVKDNVL